MWRFFPPFYPKMYTLDWIFCNKNSRKKTTLLKLKIFFLPDLIMGLFHCSIDGTIILFKDGALIQILYTEHTPPSYYWVSHIYCPRCFGKSTNMKIVHEEGDAVYLYFTLGVSYIETKQLRPINIKIGHNIWDIQYFIRTMVNESLT